jgi:hypothetical protein
MHLQGRAAVRQLVLPRGLVLGQQRHLLRLPALGVAQLGLVGLLPMEREGGGHEGYVRCMSGARG